MRTILQAQEVVRVAELKLKEILEAALRDRRYSDLSDVLPIAEAVAQITLRFTSATFGELPTAPTTRGEVATKQAYPHFRRDGDKLVKIGWSKKDRSSYEHRAPLETVFLLASTLSDRVAANSAFKMEDFVPLRMGKNKELPTYQTYLALAWFRSLGIVQEAGRAGYVFKPEALDKKLIERHWTALQAIGDQ